MADLNKYEEICEKYGNTKEVQDAVREAFTFKEAEFGKYHKPIYEVEDFQEYKRHLIQLRPDVVLLLHIFEKTANGEFESAWLDDNEKHYYEDFKCIKDSAHQLLLQLEGHWCTAFIEALRDECNEIISHEKQEASNEI